MAAPGKRLIVLCIAVVLGGCAVFTTTPIQRIALLAPFEGQYREVGYQALYAARLAIAETNRIDLELLAVDDGGTLEHAQDRARALSQDPLVKAVMVMGIYPTDPTVLDLFRSDLPVVIVGDWAGASDEDGQYARQITDIAALDGPIVCGDLCQLTAYKALEDDLRLVHIETYAAPVDETFANAYKSMDQFAPDPLPLARLAYNATHNALGIIDVVPPVSFPGDTRYTYRYDTNGTLIYVSDERPVITP